MQWLIDIAIEAMENWFALYGGYHHRGDPVNPDFNHTNLTLDGAYHELDLSAIVPEGAKAVYLKVQVINQGVQQGFEFVRHGMVHKHVALLQVTQVAGVGITLCGAVAVDEDRKVDYWFQAGNWTAILITVCGWWF